MIYANFTHYRKKYYDFCIEETCIETINPLGIFCQREGDRMSTIYSEYLSSHPR